MVSDLLAVRSDARRRDHSGVSTSTKSWRSSRSCSSQGSETTARLLGWAAVLLARHPDQRAKLVADARTRAQRGRGAAALRSAVADPGALRDPRCRVARPEGAAVLEARHAHRQRGPRRARVSPTPTASTSSARSTVTSRSATASTSASAPAWPASKAGSCSKRRSPGSPTGASTRPRSRWCERRPCAARCTCRSRSEPRTGRTGEQWTHSTGSVAVVTGGASGIGLALARAFLARGDEGRRRRRRGDRARPRPGRARRASARSLGVVTDVTDPASVERARRRHVRSVRRVPRAVQQRRRRRAVVDGVGDHGERLALGPRRQRDGRRPRHPGLRAAHDRVGRTRLCRQHVVGRRRHRADADGVGVRREQGRGHFAHRVPRDAVRLRGHQPAGRHLLSVRRAAAHRVVDRGSQPTGRARPGASACDRGDDHREARGDGEARRPRAEVPGSRRARAGRRRRHPRRAFHHDDRRRVDRRRPCASARPRSSRACSPSSTRGSSVDERVGAHRDRRRGRRRAHARRRGPSQRVVAADERRARRCSRRGARG